MLHLEIDDSSSKSSEGLGQARRGQQAVLTILQEQKIKQVVASSYIAP
jgi:hypothetical protein